MYYLQLKFISFLATRCLYQGVHLTVHCLLNCIPQHVKMTLCSTALDHQMPLLGEVHLTWVCLTVHVKLTLHLTVNVKLAWCSTALGHQMPLLGRGTSASENLNNFAFHALLHRSFLQKTNKLWNTFYTWIMKNLLISGFISTIKLLINTPTSAINKYSKP